MKMKLRVPFLCVALLSVGIMPVAAAGPKSFSEGANSDSAEGAPAIAPVPSSVNPSKENDRTQWWAIASAMPSQKPLAKKPSSESLTLTNEEEILLASLDFDEGLGRTIKNKTQKPKWGLLL